MRKRILGLFGVLALSLLLVGLFAWVWLRSSLPVTSGVITLEGLSAPVTIRRDAHGIPYIEAETAGDAYFAVGFVHAQDRLWQLMMNRHIAAGRLSEIAGEATVSTDIFLRTLSVHDRARKAWEHQTPEAQAMLSAYADGINAAIKARKGALPPEFLLTGTQPESWTPIDSIAWLKMMAFDLGSNYGTELARLDLLSILTPEQVQQFYPPYPGDAPIPIPDLEQLYDGLDVGRIRAAAEDYGMPRDLGSNNWVISGAHTKSGKPLLANDPHLRLSTPSLWYLIHVRVKDRVMVGASMPGLPFVILGRNSEAAWGFTNVNPDVQDLYLERVLDGGETYLTPEGPAPFRTRDERIVVKGGDPVVIRVRETRHGPVISDAQKEISERLPENTVLALHWTALDPDDGTASIGPEIARAARFESFIGALRHYAAPEQNIVYADVSGDIGYHAPGRVPVRSERNEARGIVPAPGWKEDYDWLGYLPYTELPTRHNPESGVIATANEKIVEADYPHYLTSEWALPYRGDRIRALISEREDHDVASMTAIQMDVRSTVADDLLPRLLAHAGDRIDPEVREALAAWDHMMTTDRPEPLIFTAWHRFLARAVYADELGERFPRYWGPKVDFLLHVLDETRPERRWCDDVSTEAEETCDDRVVLAFEDAMADLAQRAGKDWRSWRWGRMHKVTQTHNPMSQVPTLARVFELRSQAPGGTYTVNVAGSRFGTDDPYGFGHGPSYRAVYDLSDLDASRYIIPTGQSGNPLSPHYDDMMPLWLRGESVAIAGPPDDAETLILQP
ncbi:MAG: penicillin acylase family protein [Rhodothalassiaceae bacterium]